MCILMPVQVYLPVPRQNKNSTTQTDDQQSMMTVPLSNLPRISIRQPTPFSRKHDQTMTVYRKKKTPQGSVNTKRPIAPLARVVCGKNNPATTEKGERKENAPNIYICKTTSRAKSVAPSRRKRYSVPYCTKTVFSFS